MTDIELSSCARFREDFGAAVRTIVGPAPLGERRDVFRTTGCESLDFAIDEFAFNFAGFSGVVRGLRHFCTPSLICFFLSFNPRRL